MEIVGACNLKIDRSESPDLLMTNPLPTETITVQYPHPRRPEYEGEIRMAWVLHLIDAHLHPML